MLAKTRKILLIYMSLLEYLGKHTHMQSFHLININKRAITDTCNVLQIIISLTKLRTY